MMMSSDFYREDLLEYTKGNKSNLIGKQYLVVTNDLINLEPKFYKTKSGNIVSLPSQLTELNEDEILSNKYSKSSIPVVESETLIEVLSEENSNFYKIEYQGKIGYLRISMYRDKLFKIGTLPPSYLIEKPKKKNTIKKDTQEKIEKPKKKKTIKKDTQEKIEKEEQSVNSEKKLSKTSLNNESVPIFQGCETVSKSQRSKCFQEKLNQHIRKNFRYPEIAQEMGIQGRVYVNFIIGKDGSINNIRAKGKDKSLEKEAVRIISLLPKMSPGLKGGKKVDVPYSTSIDFRLR